MRRFSDARPGGFVRPAGVRPLAPGAHRVVNRGMSKKTRKRRARKRGKHNKGKRPNARH
ncbi:hypothetical protein GCM10009727_68920 [Actinomadura napierensis]|uniref:Uncharacterized protein n=1 Tax=Actinomadura napierensis TaxID=267854 RepID=A0ABP5M674_9ACTN